MLWWNGFLYVGTNRAWHCAERAGLHTAFPWFVKYPPKGPEGDYCTPDLCDLPLQAEIWRWTPGTDQWEMMYRSPQNVPIPSHPGKYVAREVGFRDMTVFTERDGTPAMYVSSVSSRFIHRKVPPPSLLRSVDGITFEPVPQDPGTFMGSLDKCSFRTLAAYDGRLFVIVGSIQGEGILLESNDPARGNDAFRQASPPGMRLFEALPYNGYLYLGVRDPKRGYGVVKTKASGSPPYTFIPVVSEGAFLPQPSPSVISMQVYKGRLYVGTDRPGEVIRINPDDSWDLVVGTPRETPDGWKYPLSGLDAGFSNWLNGHIWRMKEHRGRFYIGTWDMSTFFRDVAGAEAVLEPNYGFDLFETDDGCLFAPITVTGFGDRYNWGLRSFADTPHGLFAGTANNWYGLQIWRGVAEDAGATCPPPARLAIEPVAGKAVLAWEPAQGATQYQVWRAEVTDERRSVEANPLLAVMLRAVRSILRRTDVYLPRLPEQLWVPRAYQKIGTTSQTLYVDETAGQGSRYLYRVQAASESGSLSAPSNIVAFPLLSIPVTFAMLEAMLDSLVHKNKVEGGLSQAIAEDVQKARVSLQEKNPSGADAHLQALSRKLAECPPGLDGFASDDLQVLLAKLIRRITLSRAGFIPLTAL
jgi:hypothetical protein